MQTWLVNTNRMILHYFVPKAEVTALKLMQMKQSEVIFKFLNDLCKLSFEKCKMESDNYFTSSKCEVSGKMESAYGRDLKNYANKQQAVA